ncbi:MAG: DNA sulfur modification protein DndE [Rubrivivax sp.]
MIDRVRLSAAARQQLITLKRRTGIEHYNVICRHALCASLANPSPVPPEKHQMSAGIEIDWKVFAGSAEDTYLNLLLTRTLSDIGSATTEQIRDQLTAHVHRGLAYLIAAPDSFGN